MAADGTKHSQSSLLSRLTRDGWLNLGFLIPYFVFFLVFLAIPVLYGLWVSLFRYELVSPDPPEFCGLGNYGEAMRDPLFWNGLWVAARYVILTVPARVALALLIAFGISRLTRFESFFRAAFFLPTIASVGVVSLVWQWFFNTDFGLFNHYLGKFGFKMMWLSDARWALRSISLMSVWWTFGSAMIILLAGIKQIPRALYEAAEVDGAGTVRQFFHITLPLLRPVMLFTLVTSVIASFQVFGQTFVMTGGGPSNSTLVIVHYIYRQAFEYYHMGYGAALSYLLFAVIVGVTLIKFKALGKDNAS